MTENNSLDNSVLDNSAKQIQLARKLGLPLIDVTGDEEFAAKMNAMTVEQQNEYARTEFFKAFGKNGQAHMFSGARGEQLIPAGTTYQDVYNCLMAAILTNIKSEELVHVDEMYLEETNGTTMSDVITALITTPNFLFDPVPVMAYTLCMLELNTNKDKKGAIEERSTVAAAVLEENLGSGSPDGVMVFGHQPINAEHPFGSISINGELVYTYTSYVDETTNKTKYALTAIKHEFISAEESKQCSIGFFDTEGEICDFVSHNSDPVKGYVLVDEHGDSYTKLVEHSAMGNIGVHDESSTEERSTVVAAVLQEDLGDLVLITEPGTACGPNCSACKMSEANLPGVVYRPIPDETTNETKYTLVLIDGVEFGKVINTPCDSPAGFRLTREKHLFELLPIITGDFASMDLLHDFVVSQIKLKVGAVAPVKTTFQHKDLDDGKSTAVFDAIAKDVTNHDLTPHQAYLAAIEEDADTRI